MGLREIFQRVQGKEKSNPIGFVWNSSPDAPESRSEGFGFNRTKNYSQPETAYGREPAIGQKIGFRIEPVRTGFEHFRDLYNRMSNPRGIGTTAKLGLAAISIAGAVAFQPQLQSLTRDIDSPRDFLNKTQMLTGSPEAKRQHVFYFYQDHSGMNPDQKAALKETAKFLNMHPDIHAELYSTSDLAAGAKDILVNEFGVDKAQLSIGGAVTVAGQTQQNAVLMTMHRNPAPN